jgi:hypothetical protein
VERESEDEPDEEESEAQTVKNLKRPYAELSTVDDWVKRSRRY